MQLWQTCICSTVLRSSVKSKLFLNELCNTALRCFIVSYYCLHTHHTLNHIPSTNVADILLCASTNTPYVAWGNQGTRGTNVAYIVGTPGAWEESSAGLAMLFSNVPLAIAFHC